MSNPNPTNPNPLALVNPGGGGDSKQPRRQQQRLKVQYVECKKKSAFLLWQIEHVSCWRLRTSCQNYNIA